MEVNNANKDGQQEGNPGNIDPNENGANHPAKDQKSQEKIGIKESGLGRYQGQNPADEHIEKSMSQIDSGTVEMQKENANAGNPSKNPPSEKDNASANAEGMDSAGYNTVDETDDRDKNDSSKEWAAENNDSGRHK